MKTSVIWRALVIRGSINKSNCGDTLRAILLKLFWQQKQNRKNRIDWAIRSQETKIGLRFIDHPLRSRGKCLSSKRLVRKKRKDMVSSILKKDSYINGIAMLRISYRDFYKDKYKEKIKKYID